MRASHPAGKRYPSSWCYSAGDKRTGELAPEDMDPDQDFIVERVVDQVGAMRHTFCDLVHIPWWFSGVDAGRMMTRVTVIVWGCCVLLSCLVCGSFSRRHAAADFICSSWQAPLSGGQAADHVAVSVPLHTLNIPCM